MKTLKRILALFALISVMAFVSGCGSSEPSKPAEQVVRESFTNLFKTISCNYELTYSGDATAPAGATSQSMNLDGKIAGVFDRTDGAKPQGTFKMDGTFTADNAAPEAADVDLRFDKQNFYILLTKLPDLGPSIPKEAIAQFLGQWWKMPIPAGTLDGLTLQPEKDEASLTTEEKAVKDLAAKTVFFKELKFNGTDSVDGASCYHYTGALDQAAIKTYFAEEAKITNQPQSADELKNMDSLLSAAAGPIEFWVSQDTMALRKVSGKLNYDMGSSGVFNLDLMFKVSNVDKPVTIEVPKTAKPFPFNPAALTGK